ncbi:hypothetical protein D9615_010579 [Tricholomella constricta]|uniref:CCHC-type domain-containing protein n=1 Tax=Tricholomella constricta TaxID=117010 RepID=A0A8H5LRX9_9AGAR|nr:hypothetical protein D9615_010579 [Tricholomella constricta]
MGSLPPPLPLPLRSPRPSRSCRTAPKPLPQGVPMDVDRMRDSAPADDHCFRCKKKGHYSRDCPLRWDDAVPADEGASDADGGFLITTGGTYAPVV